ncbi:MAG TPA: O-antigen polymerase [Flavipsychrobacter sp.]|nr:O-antigen polymerase [Flavipsychrobacter sp.]
MKVQGYRKSLVSPIYFVLGFNLFTIVIFITAPYDWSRSDPNVTVLYLLLNMAFIYAGYRLGSGAGSRRNIKLNVPFKIPNAKITSFLFIFYSLTFLIKYAYLTRFPFYDIKGMISYLSLGFFDPQLAYNLSVYDSRSFTVSWILFTFISIFNQLFFIFGFISWKSLKPFLRILLIFFVSIEVFYWLGRATAFGIISLITTLVLCIISQRKSIKISFRSMVGIIVVFAFSILFFGSLKQGRSGTVNLNLQNFDQGNASVLYNHYVLGFIPDDLTITYMYSVSYLAQGYYHLGLAMKNAPFSSTFMLGNNPALISIADNVGIHLWDRTYIHWLQVNCGIDEMAKWHSAYLWFANDVSFLGVPFILFIIAYFSGYARAFALKHNDLMSKVVFVLTMSVLLYLFANNTFLYQYFYSFTFVVSIWYFTRVRYIHLE